MTNTLHPSSLKERQRREREQLILQAAERLILEKGYHEMSMDDIALQVGIAKGTVYGHFPSKEALVSTLMTTSMQTFLGEITLIIDADVTPQSKLQAILESMYHHVTETRYRVLLALSEDQDLRLQILQRKASLLAQRELLMERLSAVFAEGQRLGVFDATIPPTTLCQLFWGMMNPRMFSRFLTEDQIPIDTLIAQVSRFFFKGIAADAR